MPVDEIAVALTVSLAGGGTLALEDPDNGYEIVGFGPGGRSWRRDAVEGRYTHGRTLINAVLESRVLTAQIRISGASWVQVQTRAQAMIDALSPLAYLVTSTVEGVATPMVCEPADVALAGSDQWDKFGIMANQQEYVLTIPYDPVKVALP